MWPFPPSQQADNLSLQESFSCLSILLVDYHMTFKSWADCIAEGIKHSPWVPFFNRDCPADHFWHSISWIDETLAGNHSVMISSWKDNLGLLLKSPKSVTCNIFDFIMSESCDRNVLYSNDMWLFILLFNFKFCNSQRETVNDVEKFQSNITEWMKHLFSIGWFVTSPNVVSTRCCVT